MTPPGATGTLYVYFRNLVVLKNPTVVEGACSFGESIETCSARDVAANAALFAQSKP